MKNKILVNIIKSKNEKIIKKEEKNLKMRCVKYYKNDDIKLKYNVIHQFLE